MTKFQVSEDFKEDGVRDDSARAVILLIAMALFLSTLVRRNITIV